MKNKTALTCILLLLPLLLAAEKIVYQVDFKIGSAVIRKPGSRKWKPLVKGDLCRAPGIIKTGPRGHLVLIKKGKQFLIGRNRIVKLSDIDGAHGRKGLFSVKQRLRHALTAPVNLRRTTVSAVRGKKVSAGTGLTWIDDLNKPLQKLETSPFKNALSAYEKEDYAKAVKILKVMVPGLSNDQKSEGRHLLMLSYFQDGRYKSALLTAELLLAGNWKNTSKRIDAYFIGAMAADYLSRYERAVSLMKQFIRWHPRSCFVPDAKVLMGEVYIKSGQRTLGERCLKEVVDKFPDSEAAAAVESLKK